MPVRPSSTFLALVIGVIVAAAAAGGLSRLASAQSSGCAVDGNGQRLPNQWCDGDVFIGQGHFEYEQLRDENGNLLFNPWDNSPKMGDVLHDGGKYLLADSEGHMQPGTLDDG